MENFQLMDLISDMADASQKAEAVLLPLLEQYQFGNDKPTYQAVCREVFEKGAPQSYRNTFDFVSGYSEIMTFIAIAADYIQQIKQMADIH